MTVLELEQAVEWVGAGRRLPMDDKINEVWRCPICDETSKTRKDIVECIDGHREDLIAALRKLQVVPEVPDDWYSSLMYYRKDRRPGCVERRRAGSWCCSVEVDDAMGGTAPRGWGPTPAEAIAAAEEAAK